MNSNIIIGYWKLIRPLNVALTFLAICIACWCAGATFEDVPIIVVAGVSAALVAAGGNAINDYFDVEIDRINKPHRPIPAGLLSPSHAKRLWLLVSLLGFFWSLFLPLLSIAIVLFAIGMLYWYSAHWKGSVLIGNILVALLTGMAFLFGGSVLGELQRASVPAIFAFLSTFAREIVKDMEDVEGDRARNAKTLPVQCGFLPSRVLATGVLFLVLLFSVYVVKISLYSWIFTVGVIAANIIFGSGVVILWRFSDSQKIHRVSTLLKIGMVFGMIGILGGVIAQ